MALLDSERLPSAVREVVPTARLGEPSREQHTRERERERERERDRELLGANRSESEARKERAHGSRLFVIIHEQRP